MLYKKYHRNYVKQFRKGVIVEYITGGLETKVSKCVVHKEPHIECSENIHCLIYSQERPNQVVDQIIVLYDGTTFKGYIDVIQEVS